MQFSVFRADKAIATRHFSWFRGGLLLLWIAALWLRFWDLARFNHPVFDEVAYVQFGYNYLTHTPGFDAHPPLGKYFVALGIWLASLWPKDYASYTALLGDEVPTVSYRWINALLGSLVPLLVAGIAYQLTHRRSFALLAGLFVSLDGLLLVESRYALMSVHILFWGLAGHYCFLLGRNTRYRWRRFGWLLLTGVCLGAAAGVKWYGLGFWLGMVGLWCVIGLRFSKFVVFMVVAPVATYCLSWIIHLRQNPSIGFVGSHQKMLGYHLSFNIAHPQASSWWSWPLHLRPMVYWYEEHTSPDSVVHYVVQGAGNPFLWWFSTAAVIGLTVWMVANYRQWVPARLGGRQGAITKDAVAKPSVGLLVSSYVLINFFANWLPWSVIGRTSYFYYYLNAAIFSFIGLAWLVDQGLCSDRRWHKVIATLVIVLLLSAFVFWLPIHLGLPLDTDALNRRLWLDSWQW
ncbi:MAG: phospholipid carrier-dependent glycosyltransferase [Cyanobacteria bacterium J06576_12]